MQGQAHDKHRQKRDNNNNKHDNFRIADQVLSPTI